MNDSVDVPISEGQYLKLEELAMQLPDDHPLAEEILETIGNPQATAVDARTLFNKLRYGMDFGNNSRTYRVPQHLLSHSSRSGAPAMTVKQRLKIFGLYGQKGLTTSGERKDILDKHMIVGFEQITVPQASSLIKYMSALPDKKAAA